jgi:cyclopropane fatty-acyl-phospholipid synthase-like methyltransferase
VSLELYAKSEHLLGIEEATQELHELYLELLKIYDAKRVLDVGCGRGILMHRMIDAGMECKGIDLSQNMVTAAKSEGLNVTCNALREEDSGGYDAIVAVFDVLNFMDKDAISDFFKDLNRLLKIGGVFIADINTLHGFSNVADGVMVAEDERLFLSVNAHFEDNELHTEFTLFEQNKEGSYDREQDTIVQYFHPLSLFKKIKALKLIEKRNISLYDYDDKALLIFKKEQ